MKKMILFTILLMTLTACTVPRTQVTPETTTTDIPQANMPKPASIYCEQNGNKLQIVAATDGSQSGICVFPDGNVCDKWAYYRGQCGPAAQTTPTSNLIIEATSDAMDDKVGETNPNSSMPPGTTEEVIGWWGVIKRTESGAQFDDYFERQDLGQTISFGINSMDTAVKSQIESLRDSGRIVHIYGTLVSNVPDYNGSQIAVDRIEIEE